MVVTQSQIQELQEISLHTKDIENPAEGLDPTAMPSRSQVEDLEPMSPTKGLKPTTMTHVRLFYGSVLGRPKGQRWELES